MSEWITVGKKYCPPQLRNEYKKSDGNYTPTQLPNRIFYGREIKPPIYTVPVYKTAIHNSPVIKQKAEDSQKIPEPCWFFNNGGCKHKDGTEKLDSECKYLHILSDNVKRPPHLGLKKPCDKYNLEGECKWVDTCKYSHRNLTPEEWSIYYPGIPFTLKTNLQRLSQLETQFLELERRVKILEFKQDGMIKELINIKGIMFNNINRLEDLLSGNNLNI